MVRRGHRASESVRSRACSLYACRARSLSSAQGRREVKRSLITIMAEHASYTMAAIMGIGAVLGARKGSRPSLIAGTVLGGAFLFSGYAISKGEYEIGHGVAAAASLALAGSMGPRAIRTKKLMPAGGLALLGAASLLYHAYKINQLLQLKAR